MKLLRLFLLTSVLSVALAEAQTIPPINFFAAQEFYISTVDPLVQGRCTGCHQSGGIAPQQGARLVFTADAEDNHSAMVDFVTTEGVGPDYVLGKISGNIGHGGGTQYSTSSTQYAQFVEYFDKLYGPDSDNDGIYDFEDSCSDTPPGEEVDDAGCSSSQQDDDSDGVLNTADSCPDTPEDEISLVDDNGCSPNQKDADGDGVLNTADSCPNTPEEEISLVDANGCGPSQKDSDGDGVPDGADDFPDDPTESKDSDGDGYGDNAETEAGSDPNDPNDQPALAGMPIWLLLEATKSRSDQGE